MIPPAITSTRMTSIFNTGHLLLKPEIKAWAKNRNFFHRRIGQKDICKSLCPFVIHPPVVYSCSKGRKRSVEIRVCVCVSDSKPRHCCPLVCSINTGRDEWGAAG